MADPTNLVDIPQEDTVFVGDKSVMFELSKFLDDEDIIGETGITGMRAMYMVNLDKETCEKKIAQAVEARKARFDEKMKE